MELMARDRSCDCRAIDAYLEVNQWQIEHDGRVPWPMQVSSLVTMAAAFASGVDENRLDPLHH